MIWGLLVNGEPALALLRAVVLRGELCHHQCLPGAEGDETPHLVAGKQNLCPGANLPGASGESGPAAACRVGFALCCAGVAALPCRPCCAAGRTVLPVVLNAWLVTLQPSSTYLMIWIVVDCVSFLMILWAFLLMK